MFLIFIKLLSHIWIKIYPFLFQKEKSLITHLAFLFQKERLQYPKKRIYRAMTKWHLKSNRKPTGGGLNSSRKKRRSDRGSEFFGAKVEENDLRIKRVAGGNAKPKLYSSNSMSVSDKTGKFTKTKILSVVENAANPNYVRRNLMTKGAIVKTEIGLAKITSRPLQSGVISGVLIEEKK